MLFWALLASGQITMRKVDGWQTLPEKLAPRIALTSPPDPITSSHRRRRQTEFPHNSRRHLAGRQVQQFRIVCWCPNPLICDKTAIAIDLKLASQPFLELADGTKGRLVYVGGAVFDQSQDAALYRRDLIYSVEYATTNTAAQPAMLFGTETLNTALFIG